MDVEWLKKENYYAIFLKWQLDLSQAEGVAALIASRKIKITPIKP